MKDQQEEPQEYYEDEADTIVGHCVECGMDITADEYDGSGLMICDHCDWWSRAAAGGPS